MYEFRIYDEYEKYGDYDDGIYYPDRDEADADCLILQKFADSKENLIELFNELIKEYEGYTYCIREDGDVHLGGVFSPDDIEIIEEDW